MLPSIDRTKTAEGKNTRTDLRPKWCRGERTKGVRAI